MAVFILVTACPIVPILISLVELAIRRGVAVFNASIPAVPARTKIIVLVVWTVISLTAAVWLSVLAVITPILLIQLAHSA